MQKKLLRDVRFSVSSAAAVFAVSFWVSVGDARRGSFASAAGATSDLLAVRFAAAVCP